MKKLIISIGFCCFFSITSFAQFGQKGWVPYFPAQKGMVGLICIGAKNSPLCTGESAAGKDLQTSQSYGDLTTYQKKALIVKFGSLFNSNNTKVKDIKATNVWVDTVTPAFLAKADRGVQFVYSALRADTVDITIKKDRNTQINPQEIVTKISTLLPNIPLEAVQKAVMVTVIALKRTL